MKTWMLMKSSIKKNRSSSVTLVLLIAVATLLLYSSLLVLFHMNQVVDDVNRKNTGADYVSIIPSSMKKKIQNQVKTISTVDKIESEKAITYYGAIKDKRLKDAPQNIGLNFLKLSNKRTMSKVKILEKAKDKTKDAIVLPYYLKIHSKYQTGDQIEVKLNGTKKTFTVYAFYQDVMFSTPSNIDQYQMFLGDDAFDELYQSVIDGMKTYFMRVKLKEGESSADFDKAFIKKISLTKGISDAGVIGLDYETMKQGTTTTMQMVAMILIAFSGLILVISMIVVRFTILTHIESDVKNIGSMEAAGFTSGIIRRSLILQFMLLAGLGFILGIVIALFASGLLTVLVSSTIGLYWSKRLSMEAFAVVFLVVFLFVLLIAAKTSAKLKKITPIAALRNGLATYNFKKNFFPLAKTKGNLNVLLGFKQIFHSGKQNLSIGLIGFIMSFAFVLSFGMLDMFVGDDTTLLRLTGMEKTNLAVYGMNDQAIKKIEKGLKGYNEISQTMQGSGTSVALYKGKKELTTYANVWDDFNKLTVNTLYSGRYPKHDNEIVISNLVSKQLGAGLGDAITLKGKDGEFDYIIVGLSQHINHLGSSCSLTLNGMKRSDHTYSGNMLYVYLKDGVKIESFIKQLKKDFGNEQYNYINVEATFDGIFQSLSDIFSIISIVLVGITVLVIGIILYYMVKVKVVRDKTLLGIQKSIGFTTRQLIIHNVISFCTVMIISFILGSLASIIFASPLITALFSAMSFKKCEIDIAISIVLLSILALSVVSVIITTLVSLRIRKVSPKELFMD